jgi:hypothetical protein
MIGRRPYAAFGNSTVRFDGAPLIRPILFKTAIYWVCVSVVRIGLASVSRLSRTSKRMRSRRVSLASVDRGINDFPDYLVEHFSRQRQRKNNR